jgi:hypothetical protein
MIFSHFLTHKSITSMLRPELGLSFKTFLRMYFVVLVRFFKSAANSLKQLLKKATKIIEKYSKTKEIHNSKRCVLCRH